MNQALPKRTTTLLIASIAVALNTSAQVQSVLSASGSYFSNATGSIAYTIGEPVFDTHAVGSVIITQGFHQPEDDFITSAPAPAPVLEIAVFPNPTRDELFVTLADESRGWTCTLYDLCGKVVVDQALPVQRNTLDLSAFANGPYALHVIDANGQLAHTFQLIIAK